MIRRLWRAVEVSCWKAHVASGKPNRRPLGAMRQIVQ